MLLERKYAASVTPAPIIEEQNLPGFPGSRGKDFSFFWHRNNILFFVPLLYQKPCLINYQKASLTAKICQFSQSNQGASQTEGANGKLKWKPSTALLILCYGSTLVSPIEVCCTEQSPRDHSITLSLSNQDPAFPDQSVSTAKKFGYKINSRKSTALRYGVFQRKNPRLSLSNPGFEEVVH